MKIGSYMCMCNKIQSKEFEDVDINSNGRVSLNEFHEYFMKKYRRPPTNDQWFKFHLTDVNNNGYISKYDCEIFEKNSQLFV